MAPTVTRTSTVASRAVRVMPRSVDEREPDDRGDREQAHGERVAAEGVRRDRERHGRAGGRLADDEAHPARNPHQGPSRSRP